MTDTIAGAVRLTMADSTSVLIDVDDIGPVDVDEAKLRQILSSLVANAVKFAGADVTVRARQTDGWLEIAVIDTGPGISADDHERIFEPFVHGAGTTALQGAGLGLALARSYAVLHGGTLTVASETGTGATFTLRLPTHQLIAPAEALHR